MTPQDSQAPDSAETRMIELKAEVNELTARLGEARPYSLEFEEKKAK